MFGHEDISLLPGAFGHAVSADQATLAAAADSRTQARRRPQDPKRHPVRAANGVPWYALPKELGDDSTPHRRLQYWQADWTFERLW